MEVYHTEEEQIAQLKSWLRNYGPPFVIGIILALGGGFGWRTWQQKTLEKHQTAFSHYVDMQTAVNANKPKDINTQANTLMHEYIRTPYATWAAMTLAKVDVNQKNYAKAATDLTWVIDNTKSDAAKQTARLRLARLLIAQNKTDEALTLLQSIDNTHYTPLILEITGDAYLANNRPDLAQEAYQKAISTLKQKNIAPPPLLVMKSENSHNIKG